MKQLIIAVVVCALLTSTVHALSASPAKHVTQYHAGADEYEIAITNDEQRTITATLTPTGPLRELIAVAQQVTLAPGETKRVPVRIDMPQSTQPGVLESGILIEGRLVSGGTVGATTAVMHLIRVETPREGTYLTGALLSSSGIVGEEILLTVSLTNTGTEPIADAASTITIEGPTTEKLQAQTLSLAPGETKNSVVAWTPTEIGAYDAQARVRYSERELLLTNTIIIGNLSVSILRVDIGDFRLGDAFRVSVDVRNNWGEQLPVTADAQVTQRGSIVARAQSASVQVSPAEENTIPLFVESTGMVVGEAGLRVQVHYADQTVDTQVPLVVGVDSLGAEEETPQAQRTWWPVLLVLAVAIVFTSIIFIKRRRSL